MRPNWIIYFEVKRKPVWGREKIEWKMYLQQTVLLWLVITPLFHWKQTLARNARCEINIPRFYRQNFTSKNHSNGLWGKSVWKDTCAAFEYLITHMSIYTYFDKLSTSPELGYLELHCSKINPSGHLNPNQWTYFSVKFHGLQTSFYTRHLYSP